MSTPRITSAPVGVIVQPAGPLYDALSELARDARFVFFAGLPGTGKSLLIHQLAHLAHARGRTITLLQWDVARPAFEASEAGRRYPQINGVTHCIIRIAVGRWARGALTRWDAQNSGEAHLLIGETPFVGHRLIELARPAEDPAEPLLASESARFIVPVPSRAVRQHLEAERERRIREPQHARESEDAPPHVMRELWQQLAATARAMGIANPADVNGKTPYDPQVYRDFYLRILSERHAQALAQDDILPAGALSAYDFVVPCAELVPAADEVALSIHSVERDYPTQADVEREIEAWYRK
jgi:hypothetical protein